MVDNLYVGVRSNVGQYVCCLYCHKYYNLAQEQERSVIPLQVQKVCSTCTDKYRPIYELGPKLHHNTLQGNQVKKSGRPERKQV